MLRTASRNSINRRELDRRSRENKMEFARRMQLREQPVPARRTVKADPECRAPRQQEHRDLVPELLHPRSRGHGSRQRYDDRDILQRCHRAQHRSPGPMNMSVALKKQNGAAIALQYTSSYSSAQPRRICVHRIGLAKRR